MAVVGQLNILSKVTSDGCQLKLILQMRWYTFQFLMDEIVEEVRFWSDIHDLLLCCYLQ
jgi:hypothetical protein